MNQTSTALNYLWVINHLLWSWPFPGFYLRHQFNNLVLSSKVVFYLCFQCLLRFSDSCLGTHSQLQTAFIFRFLDSEKSSPCLGISLYSQLSWTTTHSFLKFKSLGNLLKCWEDKTTFCTREKRQQKRFRIEQMLVKRTGKWRQWQRPKGQKTIRQILTKPVSQQHQDQGHNL